jgi:hypothetical protein
MNGHRQETLHVANQVLVTIAVKKDPSEPKGYRLTIYPQRKGEVQAFSRSPGHSLERPEEVRWAVVGLEAGQRIRIETKEGEPNPFPDDSYEIVYPNNTICSKPPKEKPAMGHSLTWLYKVSLLDTTGELAFIDPEVIVNNDP